MTLEEKKERAEELSDTLSRWRTRRKREETAECHECGGTVWLEWDDMDHGDGCYRSSGCIQCMEAELDKLNDEIAVADAIRESEQAEARGEWRLGR